MGTCGTHEGDVKTIVKIGRETPDGIYGEDEKKGGFRRAGTHVTRKAARAYLAYLNRPRAFVPLAPPMPLVRAPVFSADASGGGEKGGLAAEW